MRKQAGQASAAVRHGRVRVRAAMVVAALALGAGCGDTRLDLRNIEAAMRHRYGREALVPIIDVACPEAVRTREGDTFDCAVTFEGGAVWTITATQLGAGKTHWTPRGRAIPGEHVEARAAAVLADQGRRGELRCGERVYVVQEGDRIACQVVTGDDASRVEISVGAGDDLHVHEAAAPARAPGAGAGAPGNDAGMPENRPQ